MLCWTLSLPDWMAEAGVDEDHEAVEDLVEEPPVTEEVLVKSAVSSKHPFWVSKLAIGTGKILRLSARICRFFGFGSNREFHGIDRHKMIVDSRGQI